MTQKNLQFCTLGQLIIPKKLAPKERARCLKASYNLLSKLFLSPKSYWIIVEKIKNQTLSIAVQY